MAHTLPPEILLQVADIIAARDEPLRTIATLAAVSKQLYRRMTPVLYRKYCPGAEYLPQGPREDDPEVHDRLHELGGLLLNGPVGHLLVFYPSRTPTVSLDFDARLSTRWQLYHIASITLDPYHTRKLIVAGQEQAQPRWPASSGPFGPRFPLMPFRLILPNLKTLVRRYEESPPGLPQIWPLPAEQEPAPRRWNPDERQFETVDVVRARDLQQPPTPPVVQTRWYPPVTLYFPAERQSILPHRPAPIMGTATPEFTRAWRSWLRRRMDRYRPWMLFSGTEVSSVVIGRASSTCIHNIVLAAHIPNTEIVRIDFSDETAGEQKRYDFRLAVIQQMIRHLLPAVHQLTLVNIERGLTKGLTFDVSPRKLHSKVKRLLEKTKKSRVSEYNRNKDWLLAMGVERLHVPDFSYEILEVSEDQTMVRCSHCGSEWTGTGVMSGLTRPKPCAVRCSASCSLWPSQGAGSVGNTTEKSCSVESVSGVHCLWYSVVTGP